MRAVVQRVSAASVTVDGTVTGQIEKGLLVYLGVGDTDVESDAQYLLKKLIGLRIFGDASGQMNLSVKDVEGSILLVSQFTLYGDVRKGKRPSFSAAMPPDRAEKVYAAFADAVRQEGVLCEEGVFGAMMNVQSTNAGPVTILLDSQKKF